MRQFIDKLPRTIYQAYKNMLLRCPQQEQARKLLQLVSAAMRPLTLREMNMAFNIRRDQKSREEVDLWPEDLFGTYVKNLCGLLVRVHESKIFLLHQTVKKFLSSRPVTTAAVEHVNSEREGRVWMHSIELKKSHRVLASICLCYLSFTVFNEERHGAGGHYDFFDYATLHWLSHFIFANIEIWHHNRDMDERCFTAWYDRWLVHKRKLSDDLRWRFPPSTKLPPLSSASFLHKLFDDKTPT